MKSPDELSSYMRDKYFGLGGLGTGEDSEYVEGILENVRNDRGRQIPMSYFLHRTDMLEDFGVPMPLDATPPPRVKSD